jgi:hypothetical protein
VIYVSLHPHRGSQIPPISRHLPPSDKGHRRLRARDAHVSINRRCGHAPYFPMYPSVHGCTLCMRLLAGLYQVHFLSRARGPWCPPSPVCVPRPPSLAIRCARFQGRSSSMNTVLIYILFLCNGGAQRRQFHVQERSMRACASPAQWSEAHTVPWCCLCPFCGGCSSNVSCPSWRRMAALVSRRWSAERT